MKRTCPRARRVSGVPAGTCAAQTRQTAHPGREIGEVLGVTESRVSQLHTKAILRLKAHIASFGAAAAL